MGIPSIVEKYIIIPFILSFDDNIKSPSISNSFSDSYSLNLVSKKSHSSKSHVSICNCI